ncbi:MAG: type II toxin-antitoxin system PemK/MazF family toxin [archaeon]
MNIRRGDVLLVDFDPVKGSKQGKIRPCLVIQNDLGNKFSNTTIVVPISSKLPSKNYPTNVFISSGEAGLKKEGIIKCSQITTISVKHRVIKKIGFLDNELMKLVNNSLKISLSLE